MAKSNTLPFLRILPVLSILTALGLLAVGLWPFNPFPKNQVAWRSGEKGVSFGNYGLIFSSGSVLPSFTSQLHADSFCTIQFQLQPQFAYFRNVGTILGFYTPENPSRFRLMQYGDELLIRKDYLNEKNQLKTDELELEHAFLSTEPLTFMITSDVAGTVAFRNGSEAGTSTHMKLLCADLAGQLVIGDSPVTHNSWQGSLLDLAIYEGTLGSLQVAQEYARLNQQSGPRTPQALAEKMIARYPFTDGPGKTIHSSSDSAPDLQVPDRFRTLHRQILVWPWQETSDKLELRDIAINVFGFIPFGLLMSACLQINRPATRAILLTVMAGFSISLTIEVLQAFIPARGSGVLDIITNTFGTGLGAMLFQWPAMQDLAAKMRLYPAREERTA